MFVNNSFSDHMKLDVYMFGSSMKFQIMNKLDRAIIITKKCKWVFFVKNQDILTACTTK